MSNEAIWGIVATVVTAIVVPLLFFLFHERAQARQYRTEVEVLRKRIDQLQGREYELKEAARCIAAANEGLEDSDTIMGLAKLRGYVRRAYHMLDRLGLIADNPPVEEFPEG